MTIDVTQIAQVAPPCMCPEMTYVDSEHKTVDLRSNPPAWHSCKYIRERNALIPAATRAANIKEPGDTPLWSLAFSAEMDRLVREKIQRGEL